MNKAVNPCVHCYYARMRTDICGIYCTGGFEKPDGTCEHFKEYKYHNDVTCEPKRLTVDAADLLEREAQSNDPLTCEGCRYQIREGWNYEFCTRRKRHWGDSYRRKPEGGGE